MIGWKQTASAPCSSPGTNRASRSGSFSRHSVCERVCLDTCNTGLGQQVVGSLTLFPVKASQTRSLPSCDALTICLSERTEIAKCQRSQVSWRSSTFLAVLRPSSSSSSSPGVSWPVHGIDFSQVTLECLPELQLDPPHWGHAPCCSWHAAIIHSFAGRLVVAQGIYT